VSTKMTSKSASMSCVARACAIAISSFQVVLDPMPLGVSLSRKRPIMDIDFKVTGRESNPQLMQIVPPNEVVILICFEVKMGESSGMLNLCIPFPVVEPIMGNFSTIQTWFTSKKTQSEEEDIRRLNQGVYKAPLEALVHLAQTRMTMGRFLKLKPGDIITTKKDIKTPLLLRVAGRPKFWGLAGKYKNFRAIQITREVQEGEEL